MKDDVERLRSEAKALEEARDRLLIEQSRTESTEHDPLIEALHEGVQALTEEIARRREIALQQASSAQAEELVEATRRLQDEILGRHKTEVEFSVTRELTRLFLEIAPVALLHASRDGTIRIANSEAMRLLELSFDPESRSFRGDWERRLVHEDGGPCSEDDGPLRRCLGSGESQPPVILGIRRSDGLVSWAVLRAAPLVKGQEGEGRGVALSALDITERRRLEGLLASA